ncbi:Uncharacterized protein TCM_039220 [Theobroma cacao]|uniref:Uncharacterized protein n=1 Tax=Theobroma cacao TaxID=3641 RepID=A0A061GRU3_THECC|nr:Uncharacterized protein TCM_039220 [Theobroma cacao]
MYTYMYKIDNKHGKPLIVNTLLEEVFIATYVYKFGVARFKDKDTLANLTLLLILDFNVIMRMDWLASCYA